MQGHAAATTHPPTSVQLCGRSLLRLADLSRAEIRAILDLAHGLKRDYAAFRGALAQRSAVLLFEKPSLRTRVSFEIGLGKLGANAVYLDHQSNRIGARESISDYGRNLERWTDAIVARVHEHSTLDALDACTRVPVVNALSEEAHPCQALADAMTLEEHGISLDSLRLAYVGDGNNVCRSLMELCAVMGGSICVVTPPTCAPPAADVRRCASLARANGGSDASVEITDDPNAVERADAIYTDAWISMGQAHDDAKIAALRRLQVDAAMMRRAGPRARFMHCLPAHRGEEVTADVIDGPASIVFDQAENRMHAQNALLMLLLGTHQPGARPAARPATTR